MKAAKQQANQSAESARRGPFIQRKCSHCAEEESTPFISPSRLGRVQTKLMVNEPGDIYEQEADRIADQVMSSPQHGGISRAPVQVQRLTENTSSQSAEAPPSVERALASPGQPLKPELREEMEERFGYDFSGVRILHDKAASVSARSIHARSYTVGSHIIFGEGEYAPYSERWRALLAHELAHVLQQRGKFDSESPNVQRQHVEPAPSRTGDSRQGGSSERARDGSVQITTETFIQAPNGAPNTRRIIGVGELITFTANRAGNWEASGTHELIPTGRVRSVSTSWKHPGTYMVTIRTRQGNSNVELQVVVPSIRVRKLREIITTGIGAGMLLEYSLTPLGVSYAGLMIHEEACNPEGLWGYFSDHSELSRTHMPHPSWCSINSNNICAGPGDIALIEFQPHNLPWPLTPGGYSWQIPSTYRIGSNEYRFARTMTQTFRIDPSQERPPYTGSVTVWKGGETVRRQYS